MKKTIKSFLLSFKNPIFILGYIFLYAKNNIYVDKKYLNKDLLHFLRKMKGFDDYFISSTGSLILNYKDKVVKIPLGCVSKKSLENNYKNYLILKSSSIKSVVDYQLHKIKNFYCMDKLKEEKISEKELAEIIYTISLCKKNYGLINFKYFQFENLGKIKNLCNIDFELKEDFYCITGPMHGDLTAGNIMKNKRNKNVLIDLDRFDFNGFPFVDEIHYFIDEKTKKHGVSFFDSIQDLLKNNSNIDIKNIYLYFLYRICNEFKDSVILHESYYIDLKKTLNLFSDMDVIEIK